MDKGKFLTTALVFVLSVCEMWHPAQAGEIGMIYLKNNGIAPADVWVNDEYQGYVLGGELLSVDKLGFDAGEKSYGGWSGQGDVTVRICQCNKAGQAYKMEVKLPKEWGTELGQSSKSPKVWFGESNAGDEPNVDGIEAPPIHRSLEADDCAGGASKGAIKTNAQPEKKKALEGTWRLFFATGGSCTLSLASDSSVYESGQKVGYWYIDGIDVTVVLRRRPDGTIRGQWDGQSSYWQSAVYLPASYNGREEVRVMRVP
ncbi:MAG: hypothetical protein KC777_15225 [Cyanobacteria bacterium HKST-UBA02]|nr:hypothetical protein [Cyanobacteria bacterium HKST-UBA02]